MLRKLSFAAVPLLPPRPAPASGHSRRDADHRRLRRSERRAQLLVSEHVTWLRTHSLTCSLAHLLPPSLPHSLTHSLSVGRARCGGPRRVQLAHPCGGGQCGCGPCPLAPRRYGAGMHVDGHGHGHGRWHGHVRVHVHVHVCVCVLCLCACVRACVRIVCARTPVIISFPVLAISLPPVRRSRRGSMPTCTPSTECCTLWSARNECSGWTPRCSRRSYVCQSCTASVG